MNIAPVNTTPVNLQNPENIQELPTEAKSVKELTVQDASSEAAKTNDFVCPGHTAFFARFTRREKGKTQATNEMQNLEKKEDVKKADYQIIEKNTIDGDNSGYFKLLNKVYTYAFEITHTHVDNSTSCSAHPDFKKA